MSSGINESMNAFMRANDKSKPKGSESELSDLLCAIRTVGELNNFKQPNITIFDTGALYLYDEKKLISRWDSVQQFVDSCT